MDLVEGSPRIRASRTADPVSGKVRWAPAKSIWIGSMTLGALIGGPLFFSWSALALFVVTTGITLCLGHSVGMHRRLIHNSFACPLWLEYGLVYLGMMVGMAGPYGMIRTHDFRDWAQRQPECHGYYRHAAGFWLDAWRQMHCEVVLNHPPVFRPEARIATDRVYRFMEATWMAQQIPWAVGFYLIGGLPWVIWGVCARVTVGVTGHWLVGHFAHREGGQHYIVEGAAAQGYDIAVAGFVSMGESWHNNHHAFPGSARLGLFEGQADLGFVFIQALERVGLAHSIVLPQDLPARPALKKLDDTPIAEPCPALGGLLGARHVETGA